MKVLSVQINNFIDTLKEPIIFLYTIPLSFCYSIYSEFNNLVFEPWLVHVTYCFTYHTWEPATNGFSDWATMGSNIIIWQNINEKNEVKYFSIKFYLIIRWRLRDRMISLSVCKMFWQILNKPISYRTYI